MQNNCNGYPSVRDETHVQGLFNSRFCLMDHRLGTNTAPWSLTCFSSVNLQGVNIYRQEGIGAVRSNRTRRHILADSDKDFLLAIPSHERILVTHAGKQTVCEPGTFRLLSKSVPFSSYMSGANPRDRFSGIAAKISGSMLRQLIPDIDDHPDLVLKFRPGAGKIMRSLFEIGLVEGGALTISQARDFSKNLIQAIANTVLEVPKPEMRRSRIHQSSHERIRESAKDFIAYNLSNPVLDCALVASHCQVSESYLHAAFASSSIKVGAYIREARLQQCRGDLQNLALRHRTITEIMMHWGFVEPTSFGRAYKTRFGKTPREERNSMTSICNS